MRHIGRFAALALSLCNIGTFAQSTANCSLHYISQPGNAYGLAAEGVNRYGTIVGYSNQSHPTPFIRYGDGTFGTITIAGAAGAAAMRRNVSGATVGYYTSGGIDHGFLNANGTTSTIDFPNSSYTHVNGINKYGTIVGSRVLNGQGTTGGFLYKGGKFTDYPAEFRVFESISDTGEIVGMQLSKPYLEGFYMTSATATPTPVAYPGSANTALFDVNAKGIMVGSYNLDGQPDQGFIYNSNTKVFMQFNVANAVGVELNGINGYNEVTGYATFVNPVNSGTYTRGFYANCTL